MSRAMLGVRPEVVEDVAVRALPRRPLAWPMRVVVVSAIALMAGGLAALADRVELLVLVVVVALVVIAALVVFGHRAWQRGRSIDLMIEAVNSVVRASAPTRDLVTVSRWKRWMPSPRSRRSPRPPWRSCPDAASPTSGSSPSTGTTRRSTWPGRTAPSSGSPASGRSRRPTTPLPAATATRCASTSSAPSPGSTARGSRRRRSASPCRRRSHPSHS